MAPPEGFNSEIDRAFTAFQAEMDRRFDTMQHEREHLFVQIKDLVAAERDHADLTVAQVAERLSAMDRATELLNETVNRVPTDVQKSNENLGRVVDERFNSVDKQFAERDTRSERESRDNKVAVDAAFAAQKEAAAKQDESNAKAIDKSEAATTETINKLGELFNSSHKALSDKIDDLKQRVQGIESSAAGGRQSDTDRHQGISSTTAIIAVVISALIVAVALYAALHK